MFIYVIYGDGSGGFIISMSKVYYESFYKLNP